MNNAIPNDHNHYPIQDVLSRSQMLVGRSDSRTNDYENVILTLQKELAISKKETIEYIQRLKQAEHDHVQLRKEWEGSVRSLHDQHSRAELAFSLAEKLETSLKSVQAKEKNKISKDLESISQMESKFSKAQEDILQKSKIIVERESQTQALKNELDAAQKHRQAAVESARLLKTKSDEEAENCKKLKQKNEEIQRENEKMKKTIKQNEEDMSAKLNQGNLIGELKTKVYAAEDKLSRKENEIQNLTLSTTKLKQELNSVFEENKRFKQASESLESELKAKTHEEKLLNEIHNKTMNEMSEQKQIIAQYTERIEVLQKQFNACKAGGDYLKEQLQSTQNSLKTLENQKKEIFAENILLKEDNLKQLQISLNASKFETEVSKIMADIDKIKQMFPDLLIKSGENSILENVRGMVQYFSEADKTYVSLGNFKAGNVVLLYCNSNGNYVVASNDESKIFLLDPDCYMSFQSQINKKIAFFGQIVFISDPQYALQNNQYKFPPNTLYGHISLTSIDFK